MLREAAKQYIARGWSVVPIPRGQKGPTIKGWPSLRITDPAAWFSDGDNIGIILGAASNLVCIDLDHPLAIELGPHFLPPTGLIAGRASNQWTHWFYHATVAASKLKLPRHSDLDGKKLTVVEILSDGNQVVVGPSIHPDGDLYDVLNGDPSEVDGAELERAVKSLYLAVLDQLGLRIQKEDTKPMNGYSHGNGLSPGKDYDERGDVRGLLVKHGWTPLHVSGCNEHWRRPSKTWGTSATLKDSKLFYVFSSSTELESDKCYGPFGLFAALECLGNFGEAAAMLRDRGFGEFLPNVDLTAIVKCKGKYKATGDPIPTECLDIPGFIGDLVRHNLETAGHPQPELAIAGALALISTCVGNKVRSFCKHHTFANLYVLGLAPTGAGKDHARRLNRDLIDQAGATKHRANEMIGSSAGILTELAKESVLLFQIDEIADLLTTMKNAAKSPYLFSVGPVLKQLYSSAGSIFRGPALKNRDEVQTLSHPHCVIYGTTVPTGFWDSVTSQQTTDGLISRFSIFEAPGYVRTASPDPREIPGRLVEFVRYWFERPSGDGNLQSVLPAAATIEHTAEAYQRAARHADEINAKQIDEARQDPQRAALWSRAAEKTNKFALLFACSRTPLGDAPKIEIGDVDLAIKLSNWLTRRTLTMMRRHIGDSEWDSIVKKAKGKLEDGMTERDANRALRFLRPEQLRQLVRDLVSCEELAFEKRETEGRPATVWRCLW